MANIFPFRGLRYNQNKIANIAAVVTPPYDIIDDIAQARYYAQHSANIIRLELGLTFPQDTPNNNRYTRAAQYLEKWIEDEVLLPETAPAIYVYHQIFRYDNSEDITRTGFICALATEPYDQGQILPHEGTLSKPKADRLQLMRATLSNFSSIFGLYSDKERTIDQALEAAIKGRQPDISLIDEANETHLIWVITAKETINLVIEAMASRPIYIADGHHRYETALEFGQEMHEQGLTGFDRIMITLVNIFDEGLLILPTHRLAGNLTNFKLDSLLKQLKDLFTVKKWPSNRDLADFMKYLRQKGESSHIFGLYAEKSLYTFQLKDYQQAAKMLPAECSDSWKQLDVAILDYLVLNNLLGIGERERRQQENLAYTHDEQWLIDQVDSGEYQIGFFLNETKVQQIIDVSSARDKMPQKSTYFYPKLLTGLVINKLMSD